MRVLTHTAQILDWDVGSCHLWPWIARLVFVNSLFQHHLLWAACLLVGTFNVAFPFLAC